MGELMDKVHGYWESAPICTSIVTAFWQRYLCKFAHATGQCEANLILKWMPLKADRVLPGELVDTMQKCGWMLVTHVPKKFTSAPQLQRRPSVEVMPPQIVSGHLPRSVGSFSEPL